MFYKKCETDYKNILNTENPKADIVTRLLNRRDKTLKKSRQAANDSLKVNRRAKETFTNTINSTLNNPAISAKR